MVPYCDIKVLQSHDIFPLQHLSFYREQRQPWAIKRRATTLQWWQTDMSNCSHIFNSGSKTRSYTWERQSIHDFHSSLYELSLNARRTKGSSFTCCMKLHHRGAKSLHPQSTVYSKTSVTIDEWIRSWIIFPLQHTEKQKNIISYIWHKLSLEGRYIACAICSLVLSLALEY